MRERWPVTPQVQVRRVGPGHGGEAGMVSGGDSPGSGPRAPPSAHATPCRRTCRARCATSTTLRSTGCCVRSSTKRAGGAARSAGNASRRRPQDRRNRHRPPVASQSGGRCRSRRVRRDWSVPRSKPASSPRPSPDSCVCRARRWSRFLGGANAENADRPAEQLRQPQNPAPDFLRRCATPRRRRRPGTFAPAACSGPSA